MMTLVKGIKDATVRLKCPHCGEVQLRARKRGRHAVYACRRCHKRFKLTPAKTAGHGG